MVSFQDNLSCPLPDLCGSQVYCKAILSDSAGKSTGVLFIFMDKICFKFFQQTPSTTAEGRENNHGFLHVAGKVKGGF